jgi:hypothetical protein
MSEIGGTNYARMSVATLETLVSRAPRVLRIRIGGPGDALCTAWWIAPGVVVFWGTSAGGGGKPITLLGAAETTVEAPVWLELDGLPAKVWVAFARVAAADAVPIPVLLQPAQRDLHEAAPAHLLGFDAGGPLALATGTLRTFGRWMSTAGRAALGPRAETPDGLCLYEAPGGPGFGGGPVLDDAGRALGIHVGVVDPAAGSLRWGLTVAYLLERLRETDEPLWRTILAAQGILAPDAVQRVLDAIPARQPTDNERLRLLRAAAVLWDFDPAALRPVEGAETVGGAWRQLFRDATAAPGAPGRWTLRPRARQEALRSLGGLDAVRAARAANPIDVPAGSPQALLDQLLADAGAIRPEALDREALQTLLVLHRWFGAVLPDLPDEAPIRGALARLEVTEPLRITAGEAFRGRVAELEQLRSYVFEGSGENRGAMVVTGIGGSGKSALVAHFLLTTEGPPRPRYAVLDFDRPALRAADAPGLLEEIVGQLIALEPALAKGLEDAAEAVASEFPDVESAGPESPGSSAGTAPGRGPTRARVTGELQVLIAQLAKGLAHALVGDRPPVLVLDSYEEIVPVDGPPTTAVSDLLNALQASLSGLRVIVLGRVGALDVPLAGPAPAPIELRGLEEEAVRAVLAARHVTDPADVDVIVRLANGNPFILRLATDYALAHGAGELREEVPGGLDAVLVQGMLYRRILDHVPDDEVRALAHPALVLRRFTADAVRGVLAGPAGLGEIDPARAEALFNGLGAVGSLVRREAPDRIAHRPDLRQVVLRLLTEEDAGRVRALDEAALAWLAALPAPEPWVRAETLYHRMRLGHPRPELEQAWAPELTSWFSEATLAEVPEEAARWLAPRILGSRSAPRPDDLVERAAQLRFSLARAMHAAKWSDAMALVGASPVTPGLDERLDELVAVTQLQHGVVAEAARWAPPLGAGGGVGRQLLHAELAEMQADLPTCLSLLDAAAEQLDGDRRLAAMAHAIVAVRHPEASGGAAIDTRDREARLTEHLLSARRSSGRAPGIGAYAGAAASRENPGLLVAAVRTVGLAPWDESDILAVWDRFAPLQESLGRFREEGVRVLGVRSVSDPAEQLRAVLLALPTVDGKASWWLAEFLSHGPPELVEAVVALTLHAMRGSIYLELRADPFADGEVS